MNWIKTTDRLPEEGKEVLVRYENRYTIGHLRRGAFPGWMWEYLSRYGQGVCGISYITHWAEITPPEGRKYTS